MANNKPAKPINPYSKSAASARRALAIAAISAIIAIIAIILALILWQHQNSSHTGLRSQLGQLQNNISQSQLTEQGSLSDLRSQLQSQDQAISQNRQTLAELYSASHGNVRQRALSQVAYELHLANLHLTIMHDTQTSLHLLEQAQDRIARLSDPSLYGLRQMISQDIAKVKLAPKVDVGHIIIQLDELAQQVHDLSFIPQSAAPTYNPVEAAKKSHSPKWYHQAWHSFKGLKDLLVIRHHKKDVQPLLTPEQQRFLKQNIQMKIGVAQWAVLHQDPTLYKETLQVIKTWLNQYDVNEAEMRTVVNTINKLENINIKPDIPSISNTLNAVDKALAQSSTPLPNTLSKPNKHTTPSLSSPPQNKPSTPKKTTPPKEDESNPGVAI